MATTITLLCMGIILLCVYLLIKENKKSIICLLCATLFFFLSLLSIPSLLTDSNLSNGMYIAETGEVKFGLTIKK